MRYTYHLARYQAAITRRLYGRLIPSMGSAPVADLSLTREVVTFSSARDLPEQVASLRSLLRHAGTPRRITVVSDGSHSPAERAVLEHIHPQLSVVQWDDYAIAGLPDRAWKYSRAHPMGKKLIALMSMPDVPTLYADSDVLFFPAAAASCELYDGRSHYLADLPCGLDPRIAAQGNSAMPPANAGMFLASGRLPLSEFAGRLLPARFSPTDTFLEQTLIHLCLHDVAASPLPSSFALHVHDRFEYRDWSAPSRSVLRHYIGTIRHKFWLAATHASTLRQS
jgi:hypothetical protein